MAKKKKEYADVVAEVDKHLYNAGYVLTEALFGGANLTDEQRKFLADAVMSVTELKLTINPDADL